MQNATISYFIKRPATAKSNRASYATARREVEQALISAMQNERFKEITMQANSPILYGGMGIGGVGIIPTLTSTSYSAQSDAKMIDRALELMVTEMERTRRHGFNQSELERAKSNLFMVNKRAYLNRNDRTNGEFVNQYISHYKSGTPIPSAEDAWRIDSTLIAETTLERVNDLTPHLYSDHNNVVMISAPSTAKTPTNEVVTEIINRVRRSQIDPYGESGESKSLMPEGIELNGSKVVTQQQTRIYRAPYGA